MIVLDTNVISELWKVEPDSNVLAWINAQAIETLLPVRRDRGGATVRAGGDTGRQAPHDLSGSFGTGGLAGVFRTSPVV